MKKIVILAVFTTALISAQTGKVGINTQNPNNTLQVNGSFGAKYNEKDTDYTLTDADYSVSYIGNTAGTFTLPAVGSGITAFSGRIYRIKNLSVEPLTVAASGSDKIRMNNITGVGNIILNNGESAEITNTNGAAGTGTWDISIFASRKNWRLSNIYNYDATAPQNINTGTVTGSFYTDLAGYVLPITIPAGHEAKVVVSYSVPIGMLNDVVANPTTEGYAPDLGYWGITLLSQNVTAGDTSYTEFDAGSRKFTVPGLSKGQSSNPGSYNDNSNGAAYTMLTASASSDYNFDAKNFDQLINFKLQAYTEIMNNGQPVIPGVVRFNMYDTAANYNWGRGDFIIMVYVK